MKKTMRRIMRWVAPALTAHMAPCFWPLRWCHRKGHREAVDVPGQGCNPWKRTPITPPPRRGGGCLEQLAFLHPLRGGGLWVLVSRGCTPGQERAPLRGAWAWVIMGVMLLAGCSAPSAQRTGSVSYESAAVSGGAQAAKGGVEEGVIYLVMNEGGRDERAPECPPLTLEGKPRKTIATFGPVQQVTLGQTFHNATDKTVDVFWKFSISHGAAVMDLKVAIGSRRFRAVVVEADQAQALYEAAIRQGRHAALASTGKGGLQLRLGQVRAGERVETEVVYAEIGFPHKSGLFVSVKDGVRVTMDSDVKKEEYGLPQLQSYCLIRESATGAPDQNPEAFPTIATLKAVQDIRELLEKDRASGIPDHAKQAYEIARQAKIVSPVSSLLMVDAKGEQTK